MMTARWLAGRTVRVVLAALTLAGGLITIAPGVASASACVAWTGVQPPNPGGSNGSGLIGVAVLSSCNAWAVGVYNNGSMEKTLIVHWNGSTWKQVPSPNPGGPDGSILTGVAATSATNVWAVGQYNNGSMDQTLIEHWNGTAWKQVPSPNPGGFPHLTGVAATSARNAWAVGDYNNLHGVQATLIEHWNGTAWRQVASPNQGSAENFLQGVAATSARNAWAVGAYQSGTAWRTLTLHWNGTAWRHVASPNPGLPAHFRILEAVTALSASNAWAVGRYHSGGTDKSMIEHWNGTAWKQVPNPNPGGHLSGVSATSSSNAWAVGFYGSSTGLRTLIEHWNGTAWKRVPSPNPGSSENQLLSVAATSATNIWAVGDYDNGPGTPGETLALHCC
jgi:hypothetical protein